MVRRFLLSCFSLQQQRCYNEF